MVREVGKRYPLTYEAIETDSNGWADAGKVRPLPFDMTLLKVQRQGRVLKKLIPGWWTGKTWEGRMLKEEDSVTYWKRNMGEFDNNASKS